MGQTPTYSLPYPETTDPADAHAQIMALANAVEAALAGQAIVPVGAIIDWPYASGNVPSWALLCYGQNISRTTYAALNTVAAAAGYPHGVGDGSSTFALPDLRGRVVAGKDDMGGTAAGRITAAISGANGTVLGVTVGAEGITLTTAAIPAHSHGGTTGNWNGATDTQGSHSHGAATGGSAPGTDAQGYHSHGGGTAGRNQGHTHTSGLGRSQGYGLSTANTGFQHNVVIVPGAGGTLFGYTTDGENVDHSHAISGDGSHSHNVSNHTHAIGADGNHAHNVPAHGHSIAAEGGGGVHRNMSPTLIVNKMMRAL